MALTDIHSHHSLEILLVDDNETNVLVTSAILRNGGFHPDTCENGLEALEAAKGKRYDIIFMDCMMPVMDGYQAANRIRNDEDSKNSQTPIVALTADLSARSRKLCEESGMDDFLAKPIRPEDINSKLDKWVYQKSEPEAQVDQAARVSAEHAAANELPILDITDLKEIYSDDSEGLEELIKDFQEMLEANYRDLCSALDSEVEFEELRSLAHCLKGTTRTIGAKRLGSVLERVENACTQNDRSTIESCNQEFHREYKALMQAL